MNPFTEYGDVNDKVMVDHQQSEQPYFWLGERFRRNVAEPLRGQLHCLFLRAKTGWFLSADQQKKLEKNRRDVGAEDRSRLGNVVAERFPFLGLPRRRGEMHKKSPEGQDDR